MLPLVPRGVLPSVGGGAAAAEKPWPDDFTDFTRRLWDQVSPYTMTSKERVASLEAATRYIAGHGIAGDFVECGVAAGGSVMAMMLTLLDMGERDRRIWLFDTFEGMPEPTEYDVGRYGTPARKTYDKRLKDGVSTWINFSLDTVRDNVSRAGYPAEHVRFVQGKVEETLPEQGPESVALLRLDTDWYESTKAEMAILFPRLAVGGAVIIDDYFRWRGSRKAVDEYVAANDIRIFWSRIDEHSVIGIKQPS